MSTIVFFHAHPDDESSQTAGMMYLAAQAGHHVVLVVATDGALGTPPDNPAAADEQSKGTDAASASATVPDAVPNAVPEEDPDARIVAHRRNEVACSAAALGIAEVRWLGYRDSGMLGWDSNDDPRSLWQAAVPEAAARLAQILDDVAADVLVGYDHHGLYGHPDHVRVFEIAMAAPALAHRQVRLLIETVNSTDNVAMVRDPETLEALRREAPEMAAMMEQVDPEAFAIGSDGLPVGLDASDIRWQIRLSPEAIAAKRRAMECHASQTSDIGFMLALPPSVFARRFGQEYLTIPGYLDAPGTVGPPRTIERFPEFGADGEV